MKIREGVATMRRPLAEERGMALVVALMVMILLSLLGVSFLGMSAIENTIAANEVHAAQAFHLAEAGVALANRTLKDSANWTLELAAAQPFPCPALVPAAFGGCSYRIENDAVDGGGPLVDSNNTVVIRASGQFQTATRQVEVVVSRPNTSLFRNALFAVEYVELSGPSLTDSYDSRLGPYNPATAGSDGDVGSNGLIEISGTTQVKGDAAAGGTVEVSGSATVTGTVTNGSPSQYVPPVSPCGPPYSSGAGLSGKYTYNSTTGLLQVKKGGSITLANGDYCFGKVEVSGGTSLTVNGPVTISVTGSLEMSGASIVNTTADAANLGIYSSYTGDYGRPGHGGVELSGGGSAYLTVYAPHTWVEVSGTSDFYGAMVGKKVEASGGSRFHYDAKLGAGAAVTGSLTLVSWKEVY